MKGWRINRPPLAPLGDSAGYPFGTAPRLVLTWLSTEAVRSKSCDLTLGESSPSSSASQVPIGRGWTERMLLVHERGASAVAVAKVVRSQNQGGSGSLMQGNA